MRVTRNRHIPRAWLELLTVSAQMKQMKKSAETMAEGRFGDSAAKADALSVLSRRRRVTDGDTAQITAPLIEETLFDRSARRHHNRADQAFARFSDTRTDLSRRLLNDMPPLKPEALKEALKKETLA